MARNNKNFHALTVYVYEIIRREVTARESRDIDGIRKHYALKESTISKIRRLALTAVDDWRGLMEGERDAVAFFASVDIDEVKRYFRTLPDRHCEAGGFCLLSVLQYLEAFPPAESQVEAFRAIC